VPFFIFLLKHPAGRVECGGLVAGDWARKKFWIWDVLVMVLFLAVCTFFLSFGSCWKFVSSLIHGVCQVWAFC